MASNWTDWYTGSMAPPLKVPGGYIPAPSAQTPMSVDEMYQGIYAPSSPGLTTRSVTTVPVVPRAPITADASARGGLGTGMQGSASLGYMPPALPNQPSGSIRMGKAQDRLPPTTRDADILTGYAPLPGNSASSAIDRMLVGGGGFGQAGTARSGSGSLTASLPSLPSIPSAPVHQLNIDPPAEEGQMYADSMGLPVRSKSGKVYQPKVPGSAVMPSGKIAPRYGGPKTAPAPAQRGGGGLFGMLFGGGGGLFGGGSGGGMFSGGQVTRAPLAGNPMVVDPSTSAGSTLESMGFSSGAVIPAATVSNLEERGYFR